MTMNAMDEQTMRQLIALLPDNVVLIDEDRTVTFVNRLEVGYRAEDVVGHHVLTVIAPDHHDFYMEILDRVFATAEAETHQVEIRRADGEPAWYKGTMFPVERDGRVVGVAAVSRNVTERVLEHRELEILRQFLPICAWCKKVRADDGQWEELESYLTRAGHERITHAMCPDCEVKISNGD